MGETLRDHLNSLLSYGANLIFSSLDYVLQVTEVGYFTFWVTFWQTQPNSRATTHRQKELSRNKAYGTRDEFTIVNSWEMSEGTLTPFSTQRPK